MVPNEYVKENGNKDKNTNYFLISIYFLIFSKYYYKFRYDYY